MKIPGFHKVVSKNRFYKVFWQFVNVWLELFVFDIGKPAIVDSFNYHKNLPLWKINSVFIFHWFSGSKAGHP